MIIILFNHFSHKKYSLIQINICLFVELNICHWFYFNRICPYRYLCWKDCLTACGDHRHPFQIVPSPNCLVPSPRSYLNFLSFSLLASWQLSTFSSNCLASNSWLNKEGRVYFVVMYRILFHPCTITRQLHRYFNFRHDAPCLCRRTCLHTFKRKEYRNLLCC